MSVVIPAHNRADRIGAAVNSALSQDYPPFEVIVVDDGSTDATCVEVERLARSHPAVRLVRHQTKRGAQAARNTGIRESRGDWVAFLDSDDRWFHDSLSVRLHVARSRGVLVVHSECDVLRAGCAPAPFGVPPIEGSSYKRMLREPGPVFPGLLVSKKVFDHIGLLDEAIVAYQEWDLAIRLARHYQFGFAGQSTFVYDCRSSDAISRDSTRAARGYEQIVSKHQWSVLRELGPRALSTHYERAAALYRDAGSDDHAARCLRKALLVWPVRPAAIARRLQRVLRIPRRQNA